MTLVTKLIREVDVIMTDKQKSSPKDDAASDVSIYKLLKDYSKILTFISESNLKLPFITLLIPTIIAVGMLVKDPNEQTKKVIATVFGISIEDSEEMDKFKSNITSLTKTRDLLSRKLEQTVNEYTQLRIEQAEILVRMENCTQEKNRLHAALTSDQKTLSFTEQALLECRNNNTHSPPSDTTTNTNNLSPSILKRLNDIDRTSP